jgi:hypothetical protein
LLDLVAKAAQITLVQLEADMLVMVAVMEVMFQLTQASTMLQAAAVLVVIQALVVMLAQ